MCGILSKKEFIEVINDVKKSFEYQNKLNSFFKNNNVEGYIIQPDCSFAVLRVLCKMFNDKDGLIEQFCLEWNFGKKTVLKTPEELYEFLIKEENKNE